MIIYQNFFEENRRIYILIQKEKKLIKYMEILEKVSYIIKNKFNNKLIYSKKYLIAEKNAQNETMFSCTSNIE